MRTLGIVAVVGIVALLVAACQEATPTPTAHPLEGDRWTVTGMRIDTPDGSHTLPAESFETTMQFRNGIYTQSGMVAGSLSISSSLGSYFIKGDVVVVLIEQINGADVEPYTLVMTYQLRGSNSLTLTYDLAQDYGGSAMVQITLTLTLLR